MFVGFSLLQTAFPAARSIGCGTGSAVGRLRGGQGRGWGLIPDVTRSRQTSVLISVPMIHEVDTFVCFSLCISFVICQFIFSIYVENILLKWLFCCGLGFLKMKN